MEFTPRKNIEVRRKWCKRRRQKVAVRGRPSRCRSHDFRMQWWKTAERRFALSALPFHKTTRTTGTVKTASRCLCPVSVSLSCSWLSMRGFQDFLMRKQDGLLPHQKIPKSTNQMPAPHPRSITTHRLSSMPSLPLSPSHKTAVGTAPTPHISLHRRSKTTFLLHKAQLSVHSPLPSHYYAYLCTPKQNMRKQKSLLRARKR